jgi:flagellin-specific chaperone FliS
VLLKNSLSGVALIREDASTNKPVSTFDYNDLNAYLLVVVGLASPPEDLVTIYDDIAKKSQARESIPLRDIQPVCRKESLVCLQGDELITKAIEVFGSGIHRILITNTYGEVVGILSQLRLLEFFWNERVNFRAIDELCPSLLRDLGIGSQQIIAVT